MLSRSNGLVSKFLVRHHPRPRGQASSASSGTSRIATQHRTFVSRTLALQDDLPYHLVMGLPALSPTMDSGALAEWYVQEGDSFAAGDALAKIETDKAAMDFEAQDDGFVAKILVEAGQGNDIPIGTPIMVTVEEQDDVAAFKDFVAPAAAAETPAPAAAAKVEEAAAPPPPPPPKQEEPKAAVAPVAAAAVETPPPPPAAAAPAPVAAFSTAWGLSVLDSSPLAKTLAKEQNDFVAKYGTTGQAPILPA